MQKILILDFGGQYNRLIARRVRENRVYCEVHPWSMPLEEIRRFDPVGIIFTGGPRSVYDPTAPHADAGVFALGVPILGSPDSGDLLRLSAACADAWRQRFSGPDGYRTGIRQDRCAL